MLYFGGRFFLFVCLFKRKKNHLLKEVIIFFCCVILSGHYYTLVNVIYFRFLFLLQNQTRLLYDQLTEKKAALQQCLNELRGHNVSEQLQVILFEGNERFYSISSYFQPSAICEVS